MRQQCFQWQTSLCQLVVVYAETSVHCINSKKHCSEMCSEFETCEEVLLSLSQFNFL